MVTRHSRPVLISAAAAVLASSALLIASLEGTAAAAAAPVPLGTTQSFSVLAGSGITNTGPTTVFGDIGTFPTTSITGLADITVGGVNHGGDAVTQRAKGDLLAAYSSAAGALPPTAVTADLGGTTLVPGIYRAASSMGLTGAVTLDAGGDPRAVFIFQAGSTLLTASDSSVVLLNGAQACNVFWQVGSSATFGTRTAFRGNVLAHASITANTKAAFEGRLLASDGAVTLDTNVITRPGCATGGGGGGGGVGGGAATPTASATPGGGATTSAGGPSGTATHPSGTTPTRPAHTEAPVGSTAAGSTGHHTSSAAGVGTDTSGRVPTTPEGSPGLPDTGGPNGALLAFGLGAVGLGAAVMAVSRRRPLRK